MNTLKKSSNTGNIYLLVFAIIVIIYWVLNLALFLKTKSIVLIIVMSLFPLLIIVYNQYIRDFSTLLIVLSILPFVYLDSGTHSSLSSKILLDIPLFVFLLLAFFSYLLTTELCKIRYSYLMFPIIMLTIYSII